jgi:ankyrin repeat protein
VQYGWTALHSAAVPGHLEVVKVLLEKGGGADLAKIQDSVSVLRRNISDNREGDGCFVGGVVRSVSPMSLNDMLMNTRREGSMVGRKQGGEASCIERHIF